MVTTSTRPPLQIVNGGDRPSHSAALQRRFERIYAEALAVEQEDARSSGQVGFVARWLVHAALPYRDPGDKPAWGRRSGSISLTIQPGYYTRVLTTTDERGRKRQTEQLVSVGFPFGVYPRLLLAWIATEAVRTRQRELGLGTSVVEFVRSIGKPHASGGPRGTVTLLRSQMIRLFSATISVSSDPDAISWQNDGFRLLDQSVIDTFWSPGDPNQLSLFRSSIKLSERFFESLVTNPVPVDLRIIRALSRSPLAIDIYCWLTYRSATLTRSTLVPWEALYCQFGSEASIRKFRELFLRSLKDVVVMYPQADVRPRPGGLLVFPAAPSVAKRGVSALPAA